MEETKKLLPKWILIVSGIFAIMEIMVSVSLCVAPESVVETVDLSAKGVYFLVYMWAARQFALGCIFAYATFKKSAPMLTISYIFLLVMFIGDLCVGIWQKEISLIMAAVVMCIVAGGMLYSVNKRN